jgi:hypothetical protein
MKDTKIVEVVAALHDLQKKVNDDRHEIVRISVRIAEERDLRTGDADLFDIVLDQDGNLIVQPQAKRL